MWISHNFDRLKTPIVNILENASPSNNFVALDIDSTVLRREGNNVEPEPTGMFVRNVALHNNLSVVYITAREESPMARQVTLDDLAHVGITDPLIVVLRPKRVQTWEGISLYKANARAYVESQTNSRCVMNVGDQWTDLMPVNNAVWQGLRRTFDDDQYLLFSKEDERWSVKLKE